MLAKNNFINCAAGSKELYQYRQIGVFNDHMMNVVAVENRTLDFHVHEDSDEMFVVLDGRMQLELDDGIVCLGVGDFIIVPKGTRHRPVCTGLVKCLLVERMGTLTDENSGGTYTAGIKSENIRQLQQSDLPLAADVIRRSFATVARNFGITEQIWPSYVAFITDERVAAKYQEGYYPFGYYDGDKLIGFVSLTDTGNSVYELSNFAVLPEYRHNGFGKRLLDFCKSKVKELGGVKITIGIIEENAVLKRWYAQNGFTHTGTHKYEHQPITSGYMEWRADQ